MQAIISLLTSGKEKWVELKTSGTVILKPMDKSFILPAVPGRCPVNCDMKIGEELVLTENLRILNEKMNCVSIYHPEYQGGRPPELTWAAVWSVS